jgi:hypothetical protein
MSPRKASGTRRRRFAGLSASTLLFAMALASPAIAASPTRGCPDQFLKLDYWQFVAYSISLGNPPEVYPPQPGSYWTKLDKNGDGLLCIMDLPDNYGQLDGLAFNGVDNVANQ